MKKTRNYYEEIKRSLSEVHANEIQIDTVKALLNECQKYYYCYLIRLNMKSAERVLKDYFDTADYIAQRKLDMDRNTKPRFTLIDKLYIELLGQIYDEYYKNEMSYDDFICSEEFKKNISKCFMETPDELIDTLSDILSYAQDNNNLFDYVLERHDFSFIHNAMENVREALNTTVPAIDISVEKVVVPEMLERIIAFLANDNIAGAMFVAAPITRALWDGEYKSYYQKSGHKTVFFNLNSQYNLTEMNHRIEAVKRLLMQYDATVKKLNDFRRMSV